MKSLTLKYGDWAIVRGALLGIGRSFPISPSRVAECYSCCRRENGGCCGRANSLPALNVYRTMKRRNLANQLVVVRLALLDAHSVGAL